MSKQRKIFIIFLLITVALSIATLPSEEKEDLRYYITRNKEPRIIVTSASLFPNDRCDIWIKNKGRSQAVDLEYYIIDEKNNEYQPLGIGYNYSIRPGAYFMVSTYLNHTGQTVDDRSFIIKYSWIKNGEIITDEKEITYNAGFDITRRN